MIRRLVDEPIIPGGMDARMGTNVNGPSLIRVPEWIEAPLGRYYLYFAHHKGDYIRLAHADALTGPWRMHTPGTLQLAQSRFPVERAHESFLQAARDAWGPLGEQDILAPHIASPDVHVDDARREIRMYFHGMLEDANQMTRVALSHNGIDFRVLPDLLGPAYFRVFSYQGWHYALVMPGMFLRSPDGLRGFEPGPSLFEPGMRHSAVRVMDDTLWVFWSRVGDAPERILFSRVDLGGDWWDWTSTDPLPVLEPELRWEGADEPLAPSVLGEMTRPVNQLRDPCLYEEDGRLYLLYCGAGEGCIGMAEVTGMQSR
jgi:hypothetical protein